MLILSLSMGIGYACADDYKVLFINDANLKFTDGRKVKVGDVFKDAKDISWQKEKQAIKAINLSTRKQTLFLGKAWVRPEGLNTLSTIKHLSTNDLEDGTEPTIYDKVKKIFDDQYDLLDSVEVETGLELTGKSYFQATYQYGDAKITKRLPHKDQAVIFDRSLFDIEGKSLEPRDVTLSIDYVDGATGIVVFVKDDIELNLIPEQLND